MKRVYVYAVIALLSCLRPALSESPSLGALIAARQASPDSAETKKALENVVSAGLPVFLQDDWLTALPVDASPLPYDLGTLVVPKSYLPTRAVEPVHSWKFGRVCYVYSHDAGSSLRLLCTVHYPTADTGRLAARMARLLALAHKTLTQKTGREAANGTGPFDVWLCATGQTGGEEWRSNLYLYDVQTQRSSIEWVREIVHEYSHLALPAIGGYSAPEYWANGYLGERLIVRWLMRLPDGPARVDAVWGDFSGAANFDRLLIAPALAQYKKIGPSPAWLARTDEAGMRYLIGQALTFDDRYGSVKLGDALARLPRFHEANGKDFAAALSQSLSASISTPHDDLHP